jgi:hypothetical protein
MVVHENCHDNTYLNWDQKTSLQLPSGSAGSSTGGGGGGGNPKPPPRISIPGHLPLASIGSGGHVF